MEKSKGRPLEVMEYFSVSHLSDSERMEYVGLGVITRELGTLVFEIAPWMLARRRNLADKNGDILRGFLIRKRKT